MMKRFNLTSITRDKPYHITKGTPKSRTIVNVDIKGNLLPKYAAELTEDIDRLRPRIAQAIKLQILRDAKRAATRRR
jgi:hypothetical protein